MKDDARKQWESPSRRQQLRRAVTLLTHIKPQEKLLSLNNPIDTNPEEEA